MAERNGGVSPQAEREETAVNVRVPPDYSPNVFGDVFDPARPAPAEMLHVSISHSGPGIDELVRFYQVVLNMRHVYKLSYPAFEFIALSHDDENHRIGIINNLTERDDALALSQGVDLTKDTAVAVASEPRDAPLRQCRIEHISWRFHSFQDVLVTARAVRRELGLWPRTSRLQGMDITIDYNDPDGNRVELLSQTHSKAQILRNLERAFGGGPSSPMQYSDLYQSFDMEKMLALFEAGESIENLRNKTWVREKAAAGLL
jgi:catechol 2,3-dioxygenase-like lactoylglutathione lyase family enzyme